MVKYLLMNILVSGLINIETSLNVDVFPINYNPIEYPFFGVSSTVSGVGYNVSKALKTLGAEVTLLSVIGSDTNGDIIKKTLEDNDINSILFNNIDETPQSVVLVDKNGRRKIYCDLKNIQDIKPLTEVELEQYSLLILTNINFNRELLKIGHEKGMEIATDVHVLSDVNDEYNSVFMKYADILFLSNEAIIDREEAFMKEITPIKDIISAKTIKIHRETEVPILKPIKSRPSGLSLALQSELIHPMYAMGGILEYQESLNSPSTKIEKENLEYYELIFKTHPSYKLYINTEFVPKYKTYTNIYI